MEKDNQPPKPIAKSPDSELPRTVGNRDKFVRGKIEPTEKK